MLIKWCATRALELILSRLRATLKDHLSIYLARLRNFNKWAKISDFQVKIKLDFPGCGDGFLLPKSDRLSVVTAVLSCMIPGRHAFSSRQAPLLGEPESKSISLVANALRIRKKTARHLTSKLTTRSALNGSWEAPGGWRHAKYMKR